MKRSEAAPPPFSRSALRTKLAGILLALIAGPSPLPAKVTWQELLNTPLPVEGLRFFTDLVRDRYATWETPPSSHYFFCTIYDTPLETGFDAARGFDLSPTVRKGAGGRQYPADFVRAVVREGFGRLAGPVDGKPYLADNGRRHSRILGHRKNALVPRASIAVNTRNPLVPSGRKVWVLDPEVCNQFGAALYTVADTGGGLFRNQIDLYWGEDDPRGSGSGVPRATSCHLAVKWIVPVLTAE